MHVRGIGLQLGSSPALHLDGLADGSDLQGGIHAHGVIRIDHNARSLGVMESRLRDVHPVRTLRNGRHRIDATAVGLNSTLVIRLQIGDLHRRAGNSCPARVGDRAYQGAEQGLRYGWDGEERQTKEKGTGNGQESNGKGPGTPKRFPAYSRVLQWLCSPSIASLSSVNLCQIPTSEVLIKIEPSFALVVVVFASVVMLR